MKHSKIKNIFSSFLYDRKNQTISNITKYHGDRIIDLYINYPTGYVKDNLVQKVSLNQLDNIISIDLKVISYVERYNNRSPFKVICEDNYKNKIIIIFFNLYSTQIKKFLSINNIYRVTGKIEYKNKAFQIIHPSNVLDRSNISSYESIYPEYNLSRKKINKKVFRNIILKNLPNLEQSYLPDEWIEKKKLKSEKWISFKKAIISIHKPSYIYSTDEINALRRRLAYDELLASYLTFFELKKKFNLDKNKFKIKKLDYTNKILNRLSFKLTKDQISSLKDIDNDLNKDFCMYRLLQGDVGSGKTIIALIVAANIVKNGFQTVLMAPTEILAKQHYDYFCDLLPDMVEEISLLTGKSKNKKEIYKKVSGNKIKILIGTHAVYNKDINFKNLGLIIIDEQHKFGVKQRIKLLEKSKFCHTLIMSATPIPRSLSFVIYGEISISDIKTKPQGRKKIVTSIVSRNKLLSLIEGIKRKIENNEQVFWILPTINNDDSSYETVLSRYEFLKKIFKNKVEMIHGKLAKNILDETVNKFRERKFSILVSTTVIEVGVNIPSATLMIIERAEMFGLAQLHQLRGRVARGNKEGNCVLIYNEKLSEVSKERLLILRNCDDGFKISEKDLEIRGAGDFFGTNQSGIPVWKFFRPSYDMDLILDAKKRCEALLDNHKANETKISFLRDVFYKNENFMNYFSV